MKAKMIYNDTRSSILICQIVITILLSNYLAIFLSKTYQISNAFLSKEKIFKVLLNLDYSQISQRYT